MADTEHPPIPSEIAGYQVVRMLGEGGMSVVYAAMQQQPRRLVAIKVLKGSTFPPSILRRFKQEVEILGKLRHPGIAQVYDAGTWDDGSGAKPYFVMEHIPGGREIDDYLKEQDATIEQRVRLFVRVCAAIDHGHQRQVIHRDLKPGNILIDERGEPKVIDYGVARVSEVQLDNNTMHTEAGRLVGTVQYMAPEQVDMAMRDIDGRCDVYAMGVLLYLLLTGVMPHEFEGQPIFEAMRVIREDSPQGLRRINGQIDRDLETIVLTCLEKERGRRYKDAGELGRDLLRYLKHEPINARRPSPLYRASKFARRHRLAMLAVTITVTALAIAAGVFVLNRGSLGATEVAAMQNSIEREKALRKQAETVRDEALADQKFIPSTPYVLRGLDAPVSMMDIGEAMTLAAASEESVSVWSLPDGRRVGVGDTADLSPKHMAISHDGTALLIVGKQEAVVLDIASGQSYRWDLPRRGVTAAAVSRDGSMIAIAFGDFSLTVFDVKGGSLGRVTSATGAFESLDFGADGLLGGLTESRGLFWQCHNGIVEQDRFNMLGLVEVLDFTFNAAGTASLMLDASGTVHSYSLDGSGSASRRAVGMGELVAGSFDPAGTAVLAIEPTTMYVVSLDTYEMRTPTMPVPLEDTPYILGPEAMFIAHGSPGGDVTVIPLAQAAP
ncbi:MAG: WD40 repeat domain-containing serine/threonine protein kinase [Phycisphaerales bacterium]|nr:WD40 repeat domain-containing serine/threonine protein kinase [Phycisphaerales bacterium]